MTLTLIGFIQRHLWMNCPEPCYNILLIFLYLRVLTFYIYENVVCQLLCYISLYKFWTISKYSFHVVLFSLRCNRKNWNISGINTLNKWLKSFNFRIAWKIIYFCSLCIKTNIFSCLHLMDCNRCKEKTNEKRRSDLVL